MKKYVFILIGIVAISLTSCLKKDLEDLFDFDDNDITGVPRVEYRYISDEISPSNGQKLVKNVNMIIRKVDIDEDLKEVKIQLTVPNANTSFTDEERNKVSLSNLVVMVNLSTAARIFPLDNSPLLGVPGDWSKPNKYQVQAANGKTAQWTIEITELTK